MRQLNQPEIDALNETDDAQPGDAPFEATIGELAALGYGTACGAVPNTAFAALAAKGYQHRKVRSYLNQADKTVGTMIHIKIQTERTAEKVERIAAQGGGSLRFDSESQFPGFMMFETE